MDARGKLKIRQLPCNVVPDSADDTHNILDTCETDSGIVADYEQASEDGISAPSPIVEPQCRGNTNTGTLDANTSLMARNGRGKFVLDKEEMMQMVNILRDLMASQQQTKSTSLTSKVFCRANVAMAIVGEAGCRLFFPDGSLTLDIPRGALTKEEVIFVYKPINTGHHESTGNMIHYGPVLHCGPEGTTFLRKVKLSCQHYAQCNGDSGVFTVQKCDNTSSPWNVLDDEDVKIHERTVDVLLSSFSLIRFIVDGAIEAHVPKKVMVCVFGVLQLPGTGKVAHVCFVENDPCVIQVNEVLLKNKGCKEDAVFALPVEIDPRIDVTFTVIASHLGLDGHSERATASIRPSSEQIAPISLDLGDSATTPAKCIKVSQGDMFIATYNIPDESFKHHTTLVKTPRQADQDFSFEVPPPLSTEERSEEASILWKEHSFEVYDGSHRMEVNNEELLGAVGGALGDSRLHESTRSTKEQTRPSSHLLGHSPSALGHKVTHERTRHSAGSPDTCLWPSMGLDSIVGNQEIQEFGGLLSSQREGSGSLAGSPGIQQASSPSSSPPFPCFLQRGGSGSNMSFPGIQKATSPSTSQIGPDDLSQRRGSGSVVGNFETIKEDEGADTKLSYAGQPRLGVEQPNSGWVGKSNRRASIDVITPRMLNTFKASASVLTWIEKPGAGPFLSELPARNLLPPIDLPRRALSEQARGMDLIGRGASTKAVIPSIGKEMFEIERASPPSFSLQSMETGGSGVHALPRGMRRITRRASIDVVTPSIRNEMRGVVQISARH